MFQFREKRVIIRILTAKYRTLDKLYDHLL